MRRREFLALPLLSVMPAVWVGSAHSQEGTKKVAILMGIANDAEGQLRFNALKDGLNSFGWQVDRNVHLDIRWAAGDDQLTRTYAAELIGYSPTVIVANSAPATISLLELTRTIPIVFVQVNDPVGLGIVKNLSHPDSNVTGFLNFEPAIAGKWLELLKEVQPIMSNVGVLFGRATTARGSGASIHLPSLQAIAPSLGITLHPMPCGNSEEIKRSVDEFARAGGQGAIIVPDVFNTVNRDVIIASLQSIPAIYPYRYFTTSGGLISYGVEVSSLYKNAANYVDRILKGAKPIDLPVQAPTKYELTINITTAKALGLTISPTLLARADEVIE